ncbi:MAG TPA: MFS transporter, partial [Frankiaceae bacterium]|nr:MFS transporter [Frankiaceae bacterium]
MGVGNRLGRGVRRVRIRLRRGGADESGLAGLVELSFVNAAGDALVAVALAGSLFFAVPVGEARSKVALYLLVTMAPFALLAPVVGPLLDRVRGRRTAMAVTCLARGLLAWQLAGSLSGLAVYPLALGLLVLSRGFGVARSAVIPRVTPPQTTLVAVNSRMSLVNIGAGILLAPIGLGLAHVPYVGYPWVLRLCAVVYLAGVLLSFHLPAHVDSAAGERTVHEVQRAPGPDGRSRLRRALGALPVALRSAAALRALVGFLIFFLAFLLRTGGGGSNAWLAALAGSAGAGSALGVFIGGKLSKHRPELLLVISLLMGAA